MRHGLLVFADSAAGHSACSRRVAGLSMLDRGVRTLARVGVSSLFVVVPAGARTPLPAHTRNLPLEIHFVSWEDVHAVYFPANEPVLVLLGDHVHHHSSLRAFQEAASGDVSVKVQTAPAQPELRCAWHAWTDSSGRLEFAPPGQAQCPVSAGSFICPGSMLRGEAMFGAGADFRGFLARQAAGHTARCVECPPLWRVVPDRRGAAAARRMLFSQVTKPTSGFISRHINARISIPISELLVGTRMSPHMITVIFVLTTGLTSAYLISRPDGYWRIALAGVLWQLAAVLDRCDGEVARVKLCESAFGAWFDTLTDNFAYLCSYIALIVGMRYLYPDQTMYTVLGAGAVAALILTLGIMYTYARRTGSGSLQHYLRDLSIQVPEAEKSWVQRLMQRCGFAAKRDFFSFVIFILLLANQVELVFWSVITLLYVAAGAVLLSQRTMLRSAASRAADPAQPTRRQFSSGAGGAP